jgi:peptidoglycan/LPS O-acetylase OafA/YrhL
VHPAVRSQTHHRKRVSWATTLDDVSQDDEPVQPAIVELGYRPALDGLRGVAIAMVVAFHAAYRAFPGGYVGVELFFVLSGFLITWLLVEEVGRTGGVRLGPFYARRALRLLPALGLLVVVYLSVALTVVTASERGQMLRGALLVGTYGSNWINARGHSVGPGLEQMWSLAIEEQFYVVWPLVMVVLIRRFGLGTQVALAALAGVVASFVEREVLQASGATYNRTYYGFDTRSGTLFLGCLLGYLMATGRLRVPPSSRRLVRASSAVAVLALIRSLVSQPTIPGLSAEAYLSVVGLCAALLIVATMTEPTGLLARGLSHPVLRWVGRRSYGIYLWHVPVFEVVRRTAPGLSTPIWAGGSIALTLAVAAGSYRWVERPALGWRRRLRPPTASMARPV